MSSALFLEASPVFDIRSEILLISVSIMPAFSLLVSASCLISSATTAKPFPASPALAASIEALRERRLVCAAMLLMTAVMEEISSAESSTVLTCDTSSFMDFWAMCIRSVTLLRFTAVSSESSRTVSMWDFASLLEAAVSSAIFERLTESAERFCMESFMTFISSERRSRELISARVDPFIPFAKDSNSAAFAFRVSEVTLTPDIISFI